MMWRLRTALRLLAAEFRTSNVHPASLFVLALSAAVRSDFGRERTLAVMSAKAA